VYDFVPCKWLLFFVSECVRSQPFQTRPRYGMPTIVCELIPKGWHLTYIPCLLINEIVNSYMYVLNTNIRYELPQLSQYSTGVLCHKFELPPLPSMVKECVSIEWQGWGLAKGSMRIEWQRWGLEKGVLTKRLAKAIVDPKSLPQNLLYCGKDGALQMGLWESSGKG
jgi:hypothetical protein